MIINIEKVRNLARRYKIPEKANCREYSLFRMLSQFDAGDGRMQETGVETPYLPLILRSLVKVITLAFTETFAESFVLRPQFQLQ